MLFSLLAKFNSNRETATTTIEQLGFDLYEKTMHVLIPEGEGVVINVTPELRRTIPFDRAIVYKSEGQINIIEECQGYLEGQRVAIQ